MTTRRRRLVLSVAAGVGVAAVTVTALTGAALSDRPDEIELAPVVAAWPLAYAVTGMKSEPLYTEHIDLAREGNAFRVRIDVRGQGNAAFGTQVSEVRVADDGVITWTEGCTKSPELCEDDTRLRGFLATAVIVGLARDGRLPASATPRVVHGTEVVCVADDALHPDAPVATVRLDPCFDRATGAVIAHWSPGSDAFVGATFAPGFRVSPSP